MQNNAVEIYTDYFTEVGSSVVINPVCHGNGGKCMQNNMVEIYTDYFTDVRLSIIINPIVLPWRRCTQIILQRLVQELLLPY